MKKLTRPPRIQASQDRRFAMGIARIAEARLKRQGSPERPRRVLATTTIIGRRNPADGITGTAAQVAAIRFINNFGPNVYSQGLYNPDGRPVNHFMVGFAGYRHSSGPVLLKESFESPELDNQREYGWQGGFRPSSVGPVQTGGEG